MKINYLIFIILILLVSCGISKKNNDKSNSEIPNNLFKMLAFEKFQADTICIPSPERTFVLCLKESMDSKLNPNSLNHFFVFSNVKQKIIYEDTIAGARISWANDTLLLISQQKGIITSEKDSGKIKYYKDLKNNKKILVIDQNYYNK